MEPADGILDLDSKRLEDLIAMSSREVLYRLFIFLIDELDLLLEDEDPAGFARGVHAQLGAALNLGAKRLATILKAADTHAIDSDRARRALKEALPALRGALARSGIDHRNGSPSGP